jgi:hypothetical protein
MSDEDNVIDDTSNVTVEDDTDTNDSVQDDSADESQDTDKLKELNKKLYERAKKAEAEAKKLKETSKPMPQEQKDMSSKDLYSLMEHKVPSKHIDEVVKASKILGKSIQETLEDGFVQARLKTLSEEDQTANATNTGGSKRTTAKITDEQIVQRYMEGKDVDPEAFALARMNLRKKK